MKFGKGRINRKEFSDAGEGGEWKWIEGEDVGFRRDQQTAAGRFVTPRFRFASLPTHQQEAEASLWGGRQARKQLRHQVVSGAKCTSVTLAP